MKGEPRRHRACRAFRRPLRCRRGARADRAARSMPGSAPRTHPHCRRRRAEAAPRPGAPAPAARWSRRADPRDSGSPPPCGFASRASSPRGASRPTLAPRRGPRDSGRTRARSVRFLPRFAQGKDRRCRCRFRRNSPLSGPRTIFRRLTSPSSGRRALRSRIRNHDCSCPQPRSARRSRGLRRNASAGRRTAPAIPPPPSNPDAP